MNSFPWYPLLPNNTELIISNNVEVLLSAHADPQPFCPWPSSIHHFPSPVYYWSRDFPTYCLRVLSLFNWPKTPHLLWNADNSLISIVSGFPCHGILPSNCWLFMCVHFLGSFEGENRDRTTLLLSPTSLQLLQQQPSSSYFWGLCQNKIKNFLSLNFITYCFFSQNLQ